MEYVKYLEVNNISLDTFSTKQIVWGKNVPSRISNGTQTILNCIVVLLSSCMKTERSHFQ